MADKSRVGQAVSLPPSTQAGQPAPHPTILCVDDSPEWLQIVTLWLTAHKYNVAIANSCPKAFEILRRETPDLILLDVLMPEMDGYEFCARLQKNECLAFVPVVFVSAVKAEQDEGRALAVGGVEYLTKPVQEAELLETVQRHLSARQKWGRLQSAKRVRPGDIRGFLEYLGAKQPHPRQSQSRLASLGNVGAKQPSPLQSQSRLASLDNVGAKQPLARQSQSRLASLDNVGAKQPLARQSQSRLASLCNEEIYTLASGMGLEPAKLAMQLAAYTGHTYIAGFDPKEVELGVLPTAYCRAHGVVPMRRDSRRCFVVSNPLDWKMLNDLESFVEPGLKLAVLVTEPANIAALFGKTRAPGNAGATSSPALRATMAELEHELGRLYQADAQELLFGEASEESAPVITLVNRIIENACEARASDIHIEPWEQEVLVRYRIDGELRVIMRLRPQKLILPIVARIKIMSRLVITERRLPQDGRMAFKEQIDLRVGTCPMQYGEKVVLRILDKRRAALPLDQLGFSPRNLELYRQKLRTPYGMILHVGPTGSGKSMSLFAALKEVLRPELNIQTIEDPIEYTLPGVNQMQVHPEIGLTFARGLRSYLRLDPDIILVGEIRDRETADAAIEAALTGHLLFATLHTNDAASTLIRFIEMGIEPYLLSSTIVMVCAQRLLRCLCPECREAYVPAAEEKCLAGLPPGQDAILHRAKGCASCAGTGYKGRIGTYEVLVPDDAIRAATGTKGVTADQLKRLAVEKTGMTTLYWDAMEKARRGTTSVDEVLSEVRRDDFDTRPAAALPLPMHRRTTQRAVRVIGAP